VASRADDLPLYLREGGSTLPAMDASVSTRVVSCNSAEMNDSVESDAFVILSRRRSATVA
jgi:hypothetical protein